MAVEEEDVESCGSRAVESYALDVNVERAEDVHMHQRLLQLAEDPARLIIVRRNSVLNTTYHLLVTHSFSQRQDNGVSCLEWKFLCFCAFGSGNERRRTKMHPLPTFGSSPNLEAFQACRYHVDDGDGAANSTPCPCTRSPFELLMGQNFLVRLVTSPIIICAEYFVGNMRHNALFRRFISALPRGGPGGMPRPIEVHAHDPLRYVGDMLGWLHQALASERELVLVLLDPDALVDTVSTVNRFSKSLENGTGKTESDLTFVLDRIFEGVCRPFKVRVEQVLQSQPSLIIACKLSNTLEFYSYTDIFVVDGWLRKIIARLTLFAHCTTWSCGREPTEELRNALEKEILKSKEQVCKQNKTGVESLLDCVEIPSDGTNVWEIDTSQLKVENKVASGSYGDLYRGTCCSQDVAIKVLKPECVSGEMLREFYKEVYIMRKVRHKNVVQFIGACTWSPNLCIMTEEWARKTSLILFLGCLTLKTDNINVERSGAAQGLSEVLSALGTRYFEHVLLDIIQNCSHQKAFVRDGYLTLFKYLPRSLGVQFQNYLQHMLPAILDGSFSNFEGYFSLPLLLPAVEDGIFNDNWCIRQSLVELLRDLLFKVAGTSGKALLEGGSDDEGSSTKSYGHAIIEAALHVWKTIVANTPKTLKEIMPVLMNTLISSLASSSSERRNVVARALGELGVCIGPSEVMASAVKSQLLSFMDELIPTIRTALCDSAGMQAIDEIVPTLLHALEDDETCDTALDGLKQILSVRTTVVLPHILPKLVHLPLSAFNAHALGALAEVAERGLNFHLGTVLPALLSAMGAKDKDVPTLAKEAAEIVALVIDEEGVRVSDSRTSKRYWGYFDEAPNMISTLIILLSDSDSSTVEVAWEALSRVIGSVPKEGLTSGSAELREQAALGLRELIEVTSEKALKDFVIPISGYALDVNVKRAEDVHKHKRLLQLAEDPARLTLFAHCTTWSCAWEPTEELRNALEKEILKSKVSRHML
ncbi:hypothetical protein NC651_011090 [Populus alba x Populus x berolinensis]|nr:hypothetical protein NC651_011090 [Populus alba x Populus x berolinensis]